MTSPHDLAVKIAAAIFTDLQKRKQQNLVLFNGQTGAAVRSYLESEVVQLVEAMIGNEQSSASDQAVETFREAAAQMAQERQRWHDEHCRPECKCADGNHLAMGIRALKV